MTDLEKKYNRTAMFYDWVDYPFERFRYRKIRERLWKGVSGKVLDAGVGTGCNMPYYPPDADVVGVDLSQKMLARAQQKMKALKKVIPLYHASVYALPFPDRCFDVVVATFLCCVVSDPLQAATEMKRVCKQNGRILLLEYVLSSSRWHRFLQYLMTPYTRWMFGVDFSQDTTASLVAAGLVIEHQEFLVADVLKMITVRLAEEGGCT